MYTYLKRSIKTVRSNNSVQDSSFKQNGMTFLVYQTRFSAIFTGARISHLTPPGVG